jgi:hypothetical protein
MPIRAKPHPQGQPFTKRRGYKGSLSGGSSPQTPHGIARFARSPYGALASPVVPERPVPIGGSSGTGLASRKVCIQGDRPQHMSDCRGMPSCGVRDGWHALFIEFVGYGREG